MASNQDRYWIQSNSEDPPQHGAVIPRALDVCTCHSIIRIGNQQVMHNG